MRLVRVVAAAASAAIGIGIMLHLRKRLRQSALENSVGAAPKPGIKRAGRKAILAIRAVKEMNERAKRRSRESANEGYLAFVSHMKAEAAMEARFLQIELESLHKNDLIFLDSDDLRDLSKLIEHVQQSRCLVLVQTRKVLTRPYCILELLTAIESQIPIVCVTVGGKPQELSYNFEEMTKLMMWMDTELEQWNPGAADVLRDHGYEDLTDVAYRLSTTIPKTISVQLNTGDSRNRLHATIEDLVNAMQEARVPKLPDKAAWLAARKKMTPPGSLGGPSPRKRANSFCHAPREHGAVAAVAALAGRGLIAQAASQPSLLPLAFAVQALASGATAAVVLQEECRAVAAAAAPLEHLLVASATDADPSTLQQVGAAVEGLAALQARCSAKAVAPLRDAGAFEPAKAALVAGVGLLRVDSPEGRAAANDLARALQGLPLAPPAPEPSVDATAMAGALQVSQAQAEAARQQRELLEMQNKVLMEQVAQMQKMMTEQQMSMQSFMAKFPQAKDEPERRLVLLKKRLMDAPQSEFAMIDDLCRNIIESGSLGDNCRAVLFNVIGEDEQRTLAMCLAMEDGGVITSKDLPEAVVEERAARKATACQYVAASGEFKCFRAESDAGTGKCFFFDLFAKGVDLANDDPAYKEVMRSLREADPVFAKNMDGMDLLMPLGAKESNVDALPVMKRVSTKVQLPDDPNPNPNPNRNPNLNPNPNPYPNPNPKPKPKPKPKPNPNPEQAYRALLNGAISAASNTNSGQFIKFILETASADDMIYLGAPVKCEGRTMGSFCTMFTGVASEDVEMQLKEKLMRAAGRVGDMLDAM